MAIKKNLDWTMNKFDWARVNNFGPPMAAMDRLEKFEPNGMVAERKRTTAYRTEVTAATGGGEKEDEKVKKKKTPDKVLATT